MVYGYRGKIDNENVDPELAGAFKKRLRDTDNYDQALAELKQLVNEKSKAPANAKRAYDIAIEKLITEINIMGYQEYFPQATVSQDIENALQGGKYREFVREKVSEDIVEIRKKKSSKPKPKRKVKKAVKKCKCK
jgi:hypothetical protein